MISEDKYTELVNRLRSTHKYLQKMQKKVMSEPESEKKYAKYEVLVLMINRTSEIVNWWDKLEYKEVKKEQHAKEIARHEEKLRNKAKAEKMMEEALNPKPIPKNKLCGYYCENHKGESYCDIGMDTVFCSKNCAYATNVSGSTKVYKR